MSIKRNRHRHGKGDRKKHEQEMAALLMPLEEIHASQAPQSDANGDGGSSDGSYRDTVIKVDSRSVRVAKDFAEDEREGASIFKMEPIVIALLLGSLAFIAFIAWQITLMPTPEK